ncbi:MAG: hypothetical protein LBE04_03565 [Prevotellaceae bacterium]|jgi:hypothetical protein|nr:hypothetical protein [Prevotellaceae bacterium]
MIQIDNTVEFWSAFRMDFAKNVFKPFVESRLSGVSGQYYGRIGMFYVEGDDRALDFNVEGLDFKAVMELSKIAGELCNQINKSGGVFPYTVETLFMQDSLLRIRLKNI